MPVKTRSMIKREQEMQRQSEQLEEQPTIQQPTIQQPVIQEQVIVQQPVIQEQVIVQEPVNLQPIDKYDIIKAYYDKCKTNYFIIKNVSTGKSEKISIDFTKDVQPDIFRKFDDSTIIRFQHKLANKSKQLIQFNDYLRTYQSTRPKYRDLIIDIIELLYKHNLYIFSSTNYIHDIETRERRNKGNKGLLVESIIKMEEIKRTLPNYYSCSQKIHLYSIFDDYKYKVVE